jgi:hypothetical protein
MRGSVGGLMLDGATNKDQLTVPWLRRVFFLCGEGPRSRCYGRTAALRLLMQPCDEDEQFFLPTFTITGAPVE